MVRRAWPVLGVLALVGGCVPLDVFKTSDTGDMPVVNVGKSAHRRPVRR